MIMTFNTMFKYKGEFYSAGDPIEVSPDEKAELEAQGGIVLDYTTSEQSEDAEQPNETNAGAGEAGLDVSEEQSDDRPSPPPTRGTRRGRGADRAA